MFFLKKPPLQPAPNLAARSGDGFIESDYIHLNPHLRIVRLLLHLPVTTICHPGEKLFLILYKND